MPLCLHDRGEIDSNHLTRFGDPFEDQSFEPHVAPIAMPSDGPEQLSATGMTAALRTLKRIFGFR